MTTLRPRARGPLAGVLAVAVALTGCGGADDSGGAAANPTVSVTNNYGTAAFRSGASITFTAIFTGPVSNPTFASICASSNGTAGIANGSMSMITNTIYTRSVVFGSNLQTNFYGRGDGDCTVIITATTNSESIVPTITAGGSYAVDNTPPVTTITTVNGVPSSGGTVTGSGDSITVAGTNEPGATVAASNSLWVVTQPTSTTWQVVVPKSVACPIGPSCGGQGNAATSQFNSTDLAGNFEWTAPFVAITTWP